MLLDGIFRFPRFCAIDGAGRLCMPAAARVADAAEAGGAVSCDDFKVQFTVLLVVVVVVVVVVLMMAVVVVVMAVVMVVMAVVACTRQRRAGRCHVTTSRCEQERA